MYILPKMEFRLRVWLERALFVYNGWFGIGLLIFWSIGKIIVASGIQVPGALGKFFFTLRKNLKHFHETSAHNFCQPYQSFQSLERALFVYNGWFGIGLLIFWSIGKNHWCIGYPGPRRTGQIFLYLMKESWSFPWDKCAQLLSKAPSSYLGTR